MNRCVSGNKGYEIVLNIPVLYPSRNAIPVDRRQEARVKKQWQNGVGLVVNAAMNRGKYKKFDVPVKVNILLMFKKKRRRDIDNYAPKWLLDVLKGKCFVDDSSEWCVPSVEIFSGAEEDGMVIRITPMKEAKQ